MQYLIHKFVGRLIVVYSDPNKAGSSLAILDGGQLRELSTPYSSYGSLSLGQTGPTPLQHTLVTEGLFQSVLLQSGRWR